MDYPYLKPRKTYQEMLSTFLGYNHNQKIRGAEWHDMTNLSSRSYPLLSPRVKRGTVSTLTAPTAICSISGKLAYTDGAILYYDGTAVTGLTLSTAEGYLDKRIIPFGALLIITPDNKWYNTADGTYGDLGASVSIAAASANVIYTMCKDDGTDYDTASITASATPPANPTAGIYWIDTGADTHVLMQYAPASASWVQIATVYTKIAATGIGAGFAEYDGVTIAGCAYTGDDAELATQIPALNGEKLLYAVSANYIIVVGLLKATFTQTAGTVTVERVIPAMDHVCVTGNRLWGCKYGSVDGVMVNEIYASAQGDPKNFHAFLGISSDSYAVSVGRGGAWTGASSHYGYPLFFKEDSIYKVFGSMPSSYEVRDVEAKGVQSGSDKSVVTVNEVLFYKSKDGVCYFDGTMPVDISEPFGTHLYTNARAGVVDGKYYISMYDTAWHLFVYDTEKKLWHREDATQAVGFATVGSELYYIDNTTKALMTVLGSVGTLEASVSWEAISGMIGHEYANAKYISRFNIRADLAADATMKVWLRYNSTSVWEPAGSLTGYGAAKAYVLPVRPKRCDHMEMKLTGTGEVFIYSIARVLEIGGDGRGNV